MTRLARVLAVLALALPGTAVAKNKAEIAFVRGVLKKLQNASFDKNVEYCGFFGYGADGKLRATRPEMGDAASCGVDYPTDMRVVASFHTHGAYSAQYLNEIPSDKDVLSDWEWGIDGYVATPGGRFWYVDGRAQTVTLICGPGCLPADPNYVPGREGRIERHYSLKALTRKFGN